MFIQKKKNSNKIRLIIVGFLFIISGFVIGGIKHLYNYCLFTQDNERIEDYFKMQEDNKEVVSSKNVIQEVNHNKRLKYDYIGILEISKINLKQGFVSKDSPYNNVNKNIQVMSESDMPDVNNGNVIIAGHSGTSRTSFFKKLPSLLIGDEAKIYYKNKIYNYVLVNIYEIDKTGTAKIIRNKEKSSLTLITCKTNFNKQLVFIFELQQII